jgi:predicted DNA-binding transcriptional regulator YafY
VLDEPAERSDRVNLDELWQQHSTRFRAGDDQLAVVVRLNPARREELVTTALAVLSEETRADGWLRVEATFQDARHARWAVWQLGTDGEALAPEALRATLRERAAALVETYAT